MSGEHARIDRLLAETQTGDGAIVAGVFERFRHDLLRHIGMEEKVLLPFARVRRGGVALPAAATLRADHGEIARRLVRSPTCPGIVELRALLERHDALEEGPDGLYAVCDELAAADATAIVERLRAQPPVPLAKYYDGPRHGAR